MVHRLHTRFLDSEDEFVACQRFWRALLESVASAAAQSGEWVSWRTEAFVNGTAFPREFRSVLEARSDRLQRAVQVLQHPAGSDSAEIAAWFQDYSDFQAVPPTSELVISLSLSRETAEYARRLLQAWLDPASSPESLQPAIHNLPKPPE